MGTDYPPVGTKDFASYIAKIRQSKAEGVYLALPGQDATIYPQAGAPVRPQPRGEADHGDPGAGEHEGRGRRHGGGDRQLALSLHGRHAAEPRVRQALPRPARHVPRHVRRRDLRGPRVAGPGHHQGRHRRRREGHRRLGGLELRGPGGPVLHAQVRPPGRAARLRGGGGEGSEVSAPDPEDPGHLPRRQGDAEVPDGGVP